MYKDLCGLQDCENQAAQEDVEVIVYADIEEEDEGGY